MSLANAPVEQVLRSWHLGGAEIRTASVDHLLDPEGLLIGHRVGMTGSSACSLKRIRSRLQTR